jgi:hypothetical protein
LAEIKVISTKMCVKKRFKIRWYCPLFAQIPNALKTGNFPNGKWPKEVASRENGLDKID